MIAKYAWVTCPKCSVQSRIRISAYDFQEETIQGDERQYVASGLHYRCKHCGAIWHTITLFENYNTNSITSVALI
jgi:hypothetical protein